jgi:hypothetical protein
MYDSIHSTGCVAGIFLSSVLARSFARSSSAVAVAVAVAVADDLIRSAALTLLSPQKKSMLPGRNTGVLYLVTRDPLLAVSLAGLGVPSLLLLCCLIAFAVP